MPLFLNVLVAVFTVAGSALLVRAAWLLFRGDYRHGFIHFALAGLAFGVAIAFLFARGLFVTVA